MVMLFPGMVATLHAAPPPGWTAQSIGASPSAGTVTSTAASGRIDVTGPGDSIDGAADSFQFIYQALPGDGEIVARVAGFTNAASHPHAGLMLRASLDDNSAHAEIFATADNGVGFRSRDTTGAGMDNRSRIDVSAPVWLKLARLGQRVTAYTSSDGAIWQAMGALPVLPSGATVYAGLSVTTDSQDGGMATFDHLTLRLAGSTPPEIATTLFGPSATAAGSASTSGGQPGAYVLTSNGRSLDGDQQSFLFFNVPFTGDGEMRARVTGLSVLGGNSSVGLMVRDSAQPDARYASIALSTDGLRRQHLAEVGDNPIRASAAGAPVIWLRLARHGALFSTFSSADGVSWAPLGKPFAIGLGPRVLFGLTMVAGGNDDTLAQATVDQVSWPQPAAVAAPLDPVIAAGLAAWRKPDGNGLRCVDCHTPFAYDIAQFNFTLADVRLATTPHLAQADADAIFAMIEKLRALYPPVGGLKDFRTFRPLQPGGGQVVGGEKASANERDAAFGFYLKDHFRLGGDRITNLDEARAAARELIDVKVASVPVGLKFNLWSRSVLREGPVTGGEIAEWLPSAGLQPRPEFIDYWFQLHDDYLRDPSNENFWAIYHASTYWTDLDLHNFTPGTTHENWRYVITGQYLANSLLAHDTLLKARGLPSLLEAQDGVRPFLSQRDLSQTPLAPFWSVGDNARVVQGRGFAAMPRRNRESVYTDVTYDSNIDDSAGWQVNDFRLTWFWLGWMMDNSLRFSGEGSTLSGEYFIGSLWSGEVDNLHTGDSDSSHGFRNHQVFFNAVQQFKLGYKPGAWRDDDGTQHFEASKGYYLAYGRWRPRPEYEADDIGLPGANAQYKRLISNHLRTAILIHTDEARKAGGTYYGEEYTLGDVPLWREVLNWADPDWAQADEAMLADLQASLNAPLTPRLRIGPLKGGTVTGQGQDVTYASFGPPQPGAFAGAIPLGSTRSAAIFSADGSLLLRVGGGVPGRDGTIITGLGQPSGDAVLATLKVGAGGIAAKDNVIMLTGLSTGSPKVAAQSGTFNAGLPTDVTIRSFGAFDGQGSSVFFVATLQGPNLSAKSNPWLCQIRPDGRLQALTGQGQDMQGRTVATLATLVGGRGTLAEGRWRASGNAFGVRLTFTDHSQALYLISNDTVSPLAWTLEGRTGALGSLPALPGRTIASFGLPGFGPDGFAVVAHLAAKRGSASNAALLTGAHGAAPSPLARQGDSITRNAAGEPVSGVTIDQLSDPVAGAGRAVAFQLTTAGKGIGAGIGFSTDGASWKLLAHESASAPGGGHWASFPSLVLPDGAGRGPVFMGTLKVSKTDGVTAANNLGLWGVDSAGTLQLLLRAGQPVTVGIAVRTVKSFTALAATPGSIGAASGYDGAGQVSALATFTDGSQALLQITVP